MGDPNGLERDTRARPGLQQVVGCADTPSVIPASDSGFLFHLTSLYLRLRWFLGLGLILISGIVTVSGSGVSTSWVMAAAGAFIVAHAFAMRMRGLDDLTSTLFIDLTAIHVTTWLLATQGDRAAALLTIVGASVLVTLFISGRTRIVALVFVGGAGLVNLLAMVDWRLSAVFSDYVGALFVSGVVSGVVSAFRSRIVQLETARALTVGVVSHELRNHLTGVIGITEVLREGRSALDPAEVTELLGLAHQGAIGAGEVIEDLLTASRAERGALESVPVPTDIGPITESVVRGFSAGGRVFELSGAPLPAWAMVDSVRYGQILRNLLTNAVRYGGPTKRVSVETIGDSVSVLISDDGDGVHPADEAAMFEPYRKAKHGKSAPGSTGLGLWIARTLARGMAGDLTYRRQGALTVFELVLAGAPRPGMPPRSPELTSSHRS
jgi:signal transduction histidine kinase